MSALLRRRLSDEQLGRRLADGEAPAFDELYRRYAHRLAAYGTHLLGDREAGDDVAQVVLMRAYQVLREGSIPDSVGPWLYRIAHNAAIDSVRKRRELPFGELPEAGREQRAADAGALTGAIAALPPRQRSVFVLREIHGLRLGEIAAQLGLTNAQVEQALFAARNRLAEQLVFGERLSCGAVLRLVGGPLDGRERRALKTHVRSCPACRRELGLRGVALSVLPLSPWRWISASGTAKLAAAAAVVGVAVTIPLSGALASHETPRLPALLGAPGPDVPLAHASTRPGPPAVRTVVVRRHAARPRPHPRPQPQPKRRRAVAPAGPLQSGQGGQAVPADTVQAPPGADASAEVTDVTAVETTTTASGDDSGRDSSGDGGTDGGGGSSGPDGGSGGG